MVAKVCFIHFDPRLDKMDFSAATNKITVVIRRGLEAQTKESARRYVIYCVGLGHMFLLVGCGRGARPYVSIGWLWAWGSAICFYYVPLGHMFVLVGCGRGARPYV